MRMDSFGDGAFSQKGQDLELLNAIVEGLMKRRLPFAESVDGRVYADVGDSAKDVALVILYYIHPKRMSRKALEAALIRHPFKKSSVVRFYNNLDDRGDCQATRKSYKT
jgi:hypothetical protein